MCGDSRIMGKGCKEYVSSTFNCVGLLRHRRKERSEQPVKKETNKPDGRPRSSDPQSVSG